MRGFCQKSRPPEGVVVDHPVDDYMGSVEGHGGYLASPHGHELWDRGLIGERWRLVRPDRTSVPQAIGKVMASHAVAVATLDGPHLPSQVPCQQDDEKGVITTKISSFGGCAHIVNGISYLCCATDDRYIRHRRFKGAGA